ncbi:MAG: class I SAM-dependent methyltransferase [Flavobacterium sp.]|nr:class I SAM-dependent methyltransferase [Flavobacterium sp.]
MYNLLKNSITRFIPKKLLFRIEPILRKCYAVTKQGSNHECVICDFKASDWVQLPNNDLLCPNCGSLARDRRLWQILKEQYIKSNIQVLDFSPSRPIYRNWKKEKNVNHIASDLSGDFMADVAYDITQIVEKENTFDLIICYHILEHVIDDVKAMSELYRVLKPNGTVLIQTPFKEGEIYEDYSITSEAERLLHFGQEDHVRVYSVEGLKTRLESVGFDVIVNRFERDTYLGFSANEIVILASK